MLLSLRKQQQQQQQKYLNSFNYLSAYVGGEEVPPGFVGRCWGLEGFQWGQGKVGVDSI